MSSSSAGRGLHLAGEGKGAACGANARTRYATLLQGERRPRLEGDEYYGVIDELCKAIKALWPHALLQVGSSAGIVQCGRRGT